MMFADGYFLWKNNYWKFYRGRLKYNFRLRPTHMAFKTATQAVEWAQKVAFRWNRMKEYENSIRKM